MKCPFCIKVCTKCKRILVAYKGNFASNGKNKEGKVILKSYCKECRKQYNKDNSEYIKRYSKQYYENNKEQRNEYNKQYYKDNSDHIKEYKKEYYKDNLKHIKQYREDNKEHRKEYNKQYYKENSEHRKEYNKQYYKDNKEQRKEYGKQKWDKYLKETGLERGKGSYGEQKVRQILREHEIVFSEQHRFDDCKFKLPLPFDFYIPSLNIAIEYDGDQHFKISEKFKGLEGFIDTIIRDTIKNDYCRRNNIRLIRIPYYEFDNIEQILSDLL